MVSFVKCGTSKLKWSAILALICICSFEMHGKVVLGGLFVTLISELLEFTSVYSSFLLDDSRSAMVSLICTDTCVWVELDKNVGKSNLKWSAIVTLMYI